MKAIPFKMRESLWEYHKKKNGLFANRASNSAAAAEQKLEYFFVLFQMRMFKNA